MCEARDSIDLIIAVARTSGLKALSLEPLRVAEGRGKGTREGHSKSRAIYGVTTFYNQTRPRKKPKD